VSERVDYQRIVEAWHAALWRENVTTDFASATDDLRGYPLVLAPALHVLSKDTVEHLARYVADGGHLVAGHLSGTVDENTRLHPGGWQAEGLRSLLGVWVEELHPLAEGETVRCESAEFGPFAGEDWTELAHAETAEVVARLPDGGAAVTRHAHGAGVAWYLSVQPEAGALAAILAGAASSAGAAPAVAGLPPGVEAVRRGDVTFLLNHTAEQVQTVLDGNVAPLEPYGVRMVTA
jgi:beta-galactosidase